MTGVKLTGDWAKSKRILNASVDELKAALPKAIELEAQYMVRKIVAYIKKGVPPPLAPLTVARRAIGGFKGTKPLIRNADLRNSITYVPEGNEAFIGVLRSSGKANIAEVMEFGATIAMQVTDKMRAFLFGVLFKKAGSTASTKSGFGSGLIIIKIPPRPFMTPVIEKERAGSAGRMEKWLIRSLPTLSGGG